jgi:hypothetical protein
MCIHPPCAVICSMTPAEEFLIHLVNLVASAGSLLLDASKDMTLLYSMRFDLVPVHMSWLSGQQWLDKLVNGHAQRFYNEIGLRKHIFMRLVHVLGRDTGLVHTWHVSAKEQLAIFLHYVHWGSSNHAFQEHFQRSADTITKCVHCIMGMLMLEKVYGAYVKLPTHSYPVPSEIRESRDFWLYFKDCIRVIDGSHIPVFVPEVMCTRF